MMKNCNVKIVRIISPLARVTIDESKGNKDSNNSGAGNEDINSRKGQNRERKTISKCAGWARCDSNT